MYDNLMTKGLPENLKHFQINLDESVRKPFQSLNGSVGAASVEGIAAELEKLLAAGQVERIDPYNEFRLKDTEKWVFHDKKSEGFFICNDLSMNPLQYIRSRVQNFCLKHNIDEADRDELVISVTEAAENAIKYSNAFPILVKHSVIANEYSIQVFNSVSELNLNDEISRGKFSEDVSLMRGVLVMSKLLDFLDISRDSEKRIVEFIGKKTLKSAGSLTSAATL